MIVRIKVLMTPDEQHFNTSQIKPSSKPCKKNFLLQDIFESSEKRNEMKYHLLYLAKINHNELVTNDKLNANISHSQNASLVSFSP